jgi:Flp pilus assembly protein TadB
MNLSLYSIPSFLYSLLPALGAAALAAVAWLSGGTISNFLERSIGKRSASRLADFAGGDNATNKSTLVVQVGSFEHRVRLAFMKYHIQVDGRENYYLWIARVGVGVGLFLVMSILGLPLLTSVVGLVAGYVFVNGQVTRVWNSTRTEMEAEIPALLAGLKSAVSIEGNVPQALDEAAKSLSNGPLRAWAVAAASRMHSEGFPATEGIRNDAAAISTSLAIVVELIGRMWTTGGEGYSAAFESAGNNLRSVLQARVMARARGAGAMQTVYLLMGGIFGMIVFLTHSPALSDAMHSPMVQLAYAAIFVLMVYGYNFVGNMIDTAV